jgi:hypothetical protein
MKSLNLLFLAAVAAILRKSTSDAFILPLRFSSRTNPSSSAFHTDANSLNTQVVMKSSRYNSGGASSTPTPNDEILREEYAKWRRKYSKGDFDPVRSQHFKANFLAVTARNNMESNRARQNGQMAPSPIQLNEYGDCSAGEYRQAMSQPQQSNSPRSMNSSPNRTSLTRRNPTQANNVGLNPSNTIINSSSANPSSRNSGRGREELSRATSQLRSVVEERRSLESELAQLKQQFEEKKKLLQNAAIEEQVCNERLALREEQKRLLNDRLANGWEDEGNQRRM